MSQEKKKTLKSVLVRLIRLVARGLARWFVLLGEHPGLSRDAGFLAWRHLQQAGRKDDPELPASGCQIVSAPGPGPGQDPGPAQRTHAGRVPSQLPPSVRRALKRRRRQAGGQGTPLGSPFLGL